MLDETSVLNAVNMRLTELFPTLPVYVSDAAEDFRRPSLFIISNGAEYAPAGCELMRVTEHIRIAYNAERDDKGLSDLIEIQHIQRDIAAGLMRPLPCEDRFLNAQPRILPVGLNDGAVDAVITYIDDLGAQEETTPLIEHIYERTILNGNTDT